MIGDSASSSEIRPLDVRARLDAFSDQVALVDSAGIAHRYDHLLARVDTLARRLADHPRSLILLEADNSPASIAVYLLGLLGHHVVLMCPPDRPETHQKLADAFSPDWLARRAPDSQEIEIVPGPGLNAGAPHPVHPELAILLSTSGSTGSAKCVRLSQRNLVANADSIADYCELGADERALLNLPIFYSFGLSVLNSHLMVGARLLLPQQSMIEPGFWAYAHVHGATSFRGVPHSYELLDRIGLAENAPPTLRHFAQAGGRLPPERVTHYAQLAKAHGWRFFVMYGQTEATARMAYLPPEKALDAPAAIGIPIPGGQFMLRDEAGAAIEAPDQVGELIYSGPNVMMGYATGRDDLALPAGPPELATGDLAVLRKDGLYEIRGRLSRFVKIFGNRIALDEVESRLAEQCHDAIATGVDGTLLIATRETGTAPAIRKELEQFLKLPRDHIQVVELEDYPRLPSGKLDYVALKAMIDPAAPACAEAATEGEDPGEAVLRAFEEIFGAEAVTPADDFLTLGGDSVHYINMALALETSLGTLPEAWESRSIGDLMEMAREYRGRAADPATVHRSSFAASNLDTLRGLACVLVAAFHVVGTEGGLRLAPDSLLRHVMDSFDFIRLPLFTAMAGYFYALMPSYTERTGRFVSRKLQTLMAPALMVGALTLILHYLVYRQPEDVFSAFFHGYLHLWYLYALTGVFLIAAVLELRGPAPGAVWLTVAVLLTPVAFIGMGQLAMSINHVASLIGFFTIGVFLRRAPWLATNPWIGIVSGILSIGFFGWELATHYDPEILWVKLLGFAAGFPAILFLFRVVPRIPALAWIGAFSFTIYLWHPTANAAVRTALRVAHVDLPVWLAFLVGMAAAIMLPVALHVAIKAMQRAKPWTRPLAIGLMGS